MRYNFWINNVGTSTGRESSVLHTAPKDIRTVMLPDSDDHYFYVADYKQMELRINFALSGQMNMVKIQEDPELDLHRAIYCEIYGGEPWQVSEEQRSEAKSTNFGVTYLMAAHGLATSSNLAATKEDIRKAEKSITNFFLTFTEVKKNIIKCKRMLEEYGYSKTLFNRYRKYPDVFNPEMEPSLRSKIYRACANSPIQGTGADVNKFAQLYIRDEFKKKGYNKLVETPQGLFPLARVVVPVHDEIVFCVHKSIPPEEIMMIASEGMEVQICDPPTTLFTGGSVIDVYSEGKDDSYEVPYFLRKKLIDNWKKTGKSLVQQPYKENLAKMIKDFQKEEIFNYMMEIKKEATEKSVEPYTLVQHDILTHVLISLYKAPNHKQLTHIERIKYATERFLEDNQETEPSPKLDDKVIESLETERDDLDELVMAYKQIDYFEEEEDFDINSEDIIEVSETPFKKLYVWRFIDACFIDSSALTLEEMRITKEVLARYRSDVGVPVFILQGEESIPLDFKVMGINYEDINVEIEAEVIKLELK